MNDLKPFLVELRSWSTNDHMDVVVWSRAVMDAFEYFDDHVGRAMFRVKTVSPLSVLETPTSNDGFWLFKENDPYGNTYELSPSAIHCATMTGQTKVW